MIGDAASPAVAAAEPPSARVPGEPISKNSERQAGASPPAEASGSPRVHPAEAPASTEAPLPLEASPIAAPSEAGTDAPDDSRGRLDELGAAALGHVARTFSAAATDSAKPSASSRKRGDNRCLVDECVKIRVAQAGSSRLSLTCASHAGALSLLVGGVPSRACQACRAFHPVERFQRGNKTCEERLKWKKTRYHEKTAFISGTSGATPRKRGRPPKQHKSACEMRSDADAVSAATAAAATVLAAAAASASAGAPEDALASQARKRAMVRAVVGASSHADANEVGVLATAGSGAGSGAGASASGWNPLAGLGSWFGLGVAAAEARVAALVASMKPTEPADVRDVSAAAIAKHLGLGDLTDAAVGDSGMREAAGRPATSMSAKAERARALLLRAHELELRASHAMELARRRAASVAVAPGLR